MIKRELNKFEVVCLKNLRKDNISKLVHRNFLNGCKQRVMIRTVQMNSAQIFCTLFAVFKSYVTLLHICFHCFL